MLSREVMVVHQVDRKSLRNGRKGAKRELRLMPYWRKSGMKKQKRKKRFLMRRRGKRGLGWRGWRRRMDRRWRVRVRVKAGPEGRLFGWLRPRVAPRVSRESFLPLLVRNLRLSFKFRGRSVQPAIPLFRFMLVKRKSLV